MKKILLLLSLLFIPISGSADEYSEKESQRAKMVADKLLKNLKKNLISALEAGKPEIAVNVCSGIAQNLAENISREEKLKIRRVSLNFRNKKDIPDDFESNGLAKFEILREKSLITPETEILQIINDDTGKKLRYLRPIIAQEMCLKCHGGPKDVSVEVREILKQKYPEDRALNHQVGDIRGAVSVIIPLEYKDDN